MVVFIDNAVSHSSKVFKTAFKKNQVNNRVIQKYTSIIEFSIISKTVFGLQAGGCGGEKGE